MGKEEKPKMKNLFIEMPVDVHQKLKDIAYVRGIPMKEIVIEFVRNAPQPEIKRPTDRPTEPRTEREG